MVIYPKYGNVLITGTSSGIGKVTARYLHSLGFRVFATVRNEEDALALLSDSSEQLVPIIMDVTNQASINQARQKVSQLVGDEGLTGLVNNAGVGFISPLECVPLDEFRWLFEVNVIGLLAVTQSFLPLIRLRKGRIVNLSSTASIFIAPFHGSYSASKLAVNGLSNALRLELKPQGIKVALVVCGSIKTPMWEKGKTLSSQVSQSFPAGLMEHYIDHYNKVHDSFFNLEQKGIQPEAVSRSIYHALTARRVKNTYYIGPDAIFYNIADKFLFGRLRDWIILHSIGLVS
jgi:NAD(P)-dependent dehydrogenase (short-subunit alcohol dehydrogenase family)